MDITSVNADELLLAAIHRSVESQRAEFLALPQWKQAWLPMERLRTAHHEGWINYQPGEWFAQSTRHGRNCISEALRRLETAELVECGRIGQRARRVRLTELGQSVVREMIRETSPEEACLEV